jgi:hypothetical protein
VRAGIGICWAGPVLFAALSLVARVASAESTFVIENVDAPGVGLNDPTPATPVGGNQGGTVGEQRMICLEYAADLWGAMLDSHVSIVVEASFAALACVGSSVQLGEAGSSGLQYDVPGLVPGVVYTEALANHLVGYDLTPDVAEIEAVFNGDIPSCVPLDWYYGLDGQPPVERIDLVETVLHELAHGLGFVTYVDLETGEGVDGMLDPFSMHILDNRLGLHWDEMTATERRASAQAVRQLVWDGEHVIQTAPSVLATGSPQLSTSPEPVGLLGFVSEANFGPFVVDAPVSGPASTSQPADGCEPMGSERRNVVLVQGGGCSALQKTLTAEEAGGVAVLVADESSVQPPSAVAARPDDVASYPVGIPTLGITRVDYDLLAAAGSGTTVSLSAQSDRLVGADELGRVYLYATDPLVLGSSVSHWDVLARPDLVLEPNNALAAGHDITLEAALLRDVGWVAHCGDGHVDDGEECDDGQSNSDTQPDACRSDCTRARCGDGVVDTGELCDDGVHTGDYCTLCGSAAGSGGSGAAGSGGSAAGSGGSGAAGFGGSAPAGSGGSAGLGFGGSSGVTGASTGGAGGTALPTASGTARRTDDSGCGCKLVARSERRIGWWFGIAACVLLGMRHRRRGARRPPVCRAVG